MTAVNVEQWSYFDRADTVENDFEATNEEGSYQKYVDDFEWCADRMKTYDERFEFKHQLSSE